MGSKGIVIFGIFLAMVLLISSEVAARELAEISNTINTPKEDIGHGGKLEGYGRSLQDYPPPDDDCLYGCCSYNEDGYCDECCTDAGEKADAEAQAKPHN